MGISLSPEEEKIRSKLENMHALISAPTQFKVIFIILILELG